MRKQEFNVGDKVQLVDFETIRKHRHVGYNNEVFRRHYDYMKKKEPLIIAEIVQAGDAIYDPEEYPDMSLRGLTTREIYYNIETPRSKCYIYEACELEPYVEPEESENTEDV